MLSVHCRWQAFFICLDAWGDDSMPDRLSALAESVAYTQIFANAEAFFFVSQRRIAHRQSLFSSLGSCLGLPLPLWSRCSHTRPSVYAGKCALSLSLVVIAHFKSIGLSVFPLLSLFNMVCIDFLKYRRQACCLIFLYGRINDTTDYSARHTVLQGSGLTGRRF